jgi:hypothetical protein
MIDIFMSERINIFVILESKCSCARIRFSTEDRFSIIWPSGLTSEGCWF